MSETGQAALAHQLGAIWARFREATLARVDQLDETVVALLENRLTDEARTEAAREAHKLAGSAGTFGFPTASVIARDLEVRFKSGALTQSDVPELSAQVVQLRTELEGTPQTPAAAKAPPARSSRPYLLLVDDDTLMTNRLTIEATARGFDVVPAFAVRDAAQLLGARRPDAVLIDLRRGGPDTVRLLDAIRALTPSVPTVVVLHAGASHRRVDIARRGVRRCVDAPIDPAHVMEAVDAEWRQSIDARATVLAVDDDPRTLATVRDVLRAHGVNLIVASEPSQFWQALEAANPDLLLLNVDMAGIDGAATCRDVRGRERWARLAIVALSTRAEQTVGADDCLSTPVDAKQLDARVIDRLEHIRAQRERAEIDADTGLWNRVQSVRLADRLLQLARRTKVPTAFAIVSMRSGGGGSPELTGEMIRGLGRVLAVSARPDEVVGRWDVNEIMMTSYGTSAGELRARLRVPLADFSLHEFRATDGSTHHATALVGIAECPEDAIDCDALALVARAASAALPAITS